MQCGPIPVDEQVVNVETLPVGLSMMSADSIVNPRGMNIWDFLVVKLRLCLPPVSSTYVGMQHCCNISKPRGCHARKSRVAGLSSRPTFWRSYMTYILS